MLYEALQTLRKELEPLPQGRAKEFTLLDYNQVGSHSANPGLCPARIPDPTKLREDLRKTAEDILIGLSRLVNSLVPVNRLPPENFGMIPKYREREEDQMRVVTLSNVCSYRRNTFFTTPSRSSTGGMWICLGL